MWSGRVGVVVGGGGVGDFFFDKGSICFRGGYFSIN